MKTMPNKDALEVACLDLFKQGYQAAGFSPTISLGADKLPRLAWASACGFAIAAIAQEYETDTMTAAQAVLNTVLGNASQLGAKLLKEGWLKEATPSDTADALLARMRAALAAKS